MRRDFVLFLLASALLGVGQSIEASVINNFLNDTYHITVAQRTILEIPREFPGFAVVLLSGVLFFLGDVRMAALANTIAAAGMMGLGLLSPNYGIMVAWLTFFSTGLHLFMPLSSSIGMNLANDGNMGKKLGQINAANTAVFLLGNLIIALWFRFGGVNYKGAFILGALSFLTGGILLGFMTPHKPKDTGFRFVLRKEYGLYYWLSVLYGARKQIFITFGPWVLIKVFGQTVTTFAILGFVVAGVGIFFKPFIGWLIDRVGERFILAGEALMLIFICIGYGFSKGFLESMGLGHLAIYFVGSCFVIDQLLVAVGMARATYLKKIALSPEDVSPTLSMGVSIDHIVSMFVPWFGAMIWNLFGYEYVFLGGALIALANLFSTIRIRIGQGAPGDKQMGESAA